MKNRVRVASMGMSHNTTDFPKNRNQRKRIMHLTDAQCLQIVNQECDCGTMGKLQGAKNGRYTLKNWSYRDWETLERDRGSRNRLWSSGVTARSVTMG